MENKVFGSHILEINPRSIEFSKQIYEKMKFCEKQCFNNQDKLCYKNCSYLHFAVLKLIDRKVEEFVE